MLHFFLSIPDRQHNLTEFNTILTQKKMQFISKLTLSNVKMSTKISNFIITHFFFKKN